VSNILDELQWRGLVAQSTDESALREAFDAGPVTFYTGFDPTAASLHVGHLVQVITMRRLQQAGHRPIVLVGGATGLIGDPRETTERSMNDSTVVAGWVDKIRGQLSPYFETEGENGAIFVNNLDWTKNLTAIDLLREVGKHFRLGTMLAKDIVARRLASDEGISFTEFSYQLLQANDFRELLHRYGCTLQSAGNDQWGNIVAGTDLIRKTEGKTVHGLTTRLITKSDGTKMGKSEGGAVWLDPEMFSPYAFYQYWLNTADDDVINYMKVFTFRDAAEINRLAAEVSANPGAREAQRALAGDLTTLVHGVEATEGAVFAAKAIFGGGDLAELPVSTLRGVAAELPSAPVVVETPIIDAVVETGLVKSKGEARRAINEGGLYLNNAKVTDVTAVLGAEDFLHGQYALLRRGKKTLAVATLAQK
jgi:tyrosyl-tRNA synthetase